MKRILFMIHGMWGGPWYFENFINYFSSKGYECKAATLRYHDVKPDDPPNPELGTVSLTDYAEDLEKEIRSLGEKPVILGHSMGGLLTQMLSARGLSAASVLLAPASPAGIMALTPSVVKSFLSVQAKWGFWKKAMRQKFGEAVYSMLHLLPEEEQREIYNRFVYESGRAAFEIGYWPLDSRKASRVDENKVTCPMLVISGTEDRITPASVVEKVARKYKTAELKKFDNHAHWLMMEPGWEDIAGYIDDWLQKTLSEKKKEEL